MASSVNKVFLLGFVGKEPETKVTPGGLQISKFSLATSEKVKKGDTYEEVTQWHNIVTFDKLAEIASKYVKKGNQVHIEGKISTRMWEDESGQKKYWTEIIANNITLLGKKEEGQSIPVASSVNYEQGGKSSEQQKKDFQDNPDEMPF